MIHPSTELFSRKDCAGVGVRATSAIPNGTLVWVRDAVDRILDEQYIEALPLDLKTEVQRLAYKDKRLGYVLCWDSGKYINHSCDANIRGLGLDAMVAVQNIPRGQEILCDYAECDLDEPLVCECRSKKCRRRIGALETLVESLLPWEIWQKEVEQAVSSAPESQPLLAVAVDSSLSEILDQRIETPKLRELFVEESRPTCSL